MHNNTRPVPEVLEVIREVERSTDGTDVGARADIALALADYFYRAEMSERSFEQAAAHARTSERLYLELGDASGEALAVHRLGLIELQKRDLEGARRLFERSLRLAREEGPDLIFLSDYERHLALVDVFSGDLAASVSRLERSMALRDAAGSRDYGLFARTLLGSVLTDLGRAAQARPLLQEALRIASELPSPVGELRTTYYLAEMHEQLGEFAAALVAFRRAEDLARSLGASSMQQSAEDGIERLTKLRADARESG